MSYNNTLLKIPLPDGYTIRDIELSGITADGTIWMSLWLPSALVSVAIQKNGRHTATISSRFMLADDDAKIDADNRGAMYDLSCHMTDCVHNDNGLCYAEEVILRPMMEHQDNAIACDDYHAPATE